MTITLYIYKYNLFEFEVQYFFDFCGYEDGVVIYEIILVLGVKSFSHVGIDN